MARDRKTTSTAKVLGLLLLPLAVIVGAVGAPLSIVYSALSRRIWAKRERRFAAQMSSVHRTISFSDFCKAVESGEGTFVCEWENVFKGPTRWWWTEDNVYAATPYPCVDHVNMKADAMFSPFLDWCSKQYIGRDGKARYVIASADQKKSIWPLLEEKSRKLDIPLLS